MVPEAVSDWGDAGLKGVAPAMIIPHLVNAIKELSAQVEALTAARGPQ